MCGLEDTRYIELPIVFIHSSIPVTENIPKQEDSGKWSYLSEAGIPHIKANVGLLIGANNSKTMEWHIINSKQGGPYENCTGMGLGVDPLRKRTLLFRFSRTLL